MKIVGVIGTGVYDKETSELAEEIGKKLAKKIITIACGGLGGVMEAVCRGAKSSGGLTIGILPGINRKEANSWIDIPIVTGMGEARNAVLVRTSQVILAISGEFGTLSEIAFALKMGKPVIGLNTWELAKQGKPIEGIIRVNTPDEAVAKVLECLNRES